MAGSIILPLCLRGICLVVIFVVFVSSIRRRESGKVSLYQRYLEKLEELYREGKVSREIYEKLKEEYQKKLREEY